MRSQASGLRIGTIAYQGPIAVVYGDVVRVSLVRFLYRGPAAQLFICWGLKAGTGAFRNGENLALSGAVKFAHSGFQISAASDYRAVELTVRADLRILKPLPAGRTYDTYAWLSRGIPSMVQSDFVELADGAGMAPDTDASVVEVLPGEVQRGEARNLNAQFVRS